MSSCTEKVDEEAHQDKHPHNPLREGGRERGKVGGREGEGGEREGRKKLL